ncbi:MAG: VWA domain-containing protein [Rhizobiales bacterium]|nr:VWA domain-containing protein [Hyphomicrobiales bacterium]
MIAPLPQAARPFVEFPVLLRAHGFAVAPEQTMGFVEAVGLLGPRDMDDIYQASRAMLGPQPERLDEFDALFRAFFFGQALAAPASSDKDDDELRVQDDGVAPIEPESGDLQESGQQAAPGELLNVRKFAAVDEATVLRRFRRAAPAALPKRRAYRRAAASRGDHWNLRQALREAIRFDGEVLHLPKMRRKLAQRRILLLIDVSGSMKTVTDGFLRLAHSLGRVAERFEAFTLGTRLTRITSAIRRRQRDQALAIASGMVSDWDGGTRIGDALQAFLAVPRFAGFARGALVVVLSDGLERGDHDAMTSAVQKLTRLAWRLDWLSPDADSVDFEPRTAALQSILPYVDHLGNGSTVEAVTRRLLMLSGARKS